MLKLFADKMAWIVNARKWILLLMKNLRNICAVPQEVKYQEFESYVLC